MGLFGERCDENEMEFCEYRDFVDWRMVRLVGYWKEREEVVEKEYVWGRKDEGV